MSAPEADASPEASPTRGRVAEASGEGDYLQAASDFSEADVKLENPLVIGLISMMTGLTDLAAIQKIYRQCWLRGLEILSADKASMLKNPDIISLLHKAGDESRKIG